MNLYEYADGDPVNNIDPTGLMSLSLFESEVAGWVHSAETAAGAALSTPLGSSAGLGAEEVLVGGGGAAAIGAAPAAVLAAGPVAGADLYNYIRTGRASGPFTRLGDAIGDALYPNTPGTDGNGQLSLFCPTEAYRRRRHYGATPNRAQIRFAAPGTFDHDPPLAQHYYEGDGNGGIPGFMMTDKDRRAFGASLKNGKSAPTSENTSQGGNVQPISMRYRMYWFGY